MRDCCPANQFDGGCEDGVCKSAAVPLGRFTKPQPIPHDTTAFQYGIVFTFAAIAILAGACFGFPEHKRLYEVIQEQVVVR